MKKKDDKIMQKVTNQEVIKATGLKRNEFYNLKKEKPNLILLLKKGVLAQRVINSELLKKSIR